MLDTTINLGNLIEIGGFIAVGFIAFIKRNASVDVIQKELVYMQEELKKIATVITELAVTNVRLANIEGRQNNFEDDIRELRRGRGFIHDAINGEWDATANRHAK